MGNLDVNKLKKLSKDREAETKHITAASIFEKFIDIIQNTVDSKAFADDAQHELELGFSRDIEIPYKIQLEYISSFSSKTLHCIVYIADYGVLLNECYPYNGTDGILVHLLMDHDKIVKEIQEVLEHYFAKEGIKFKSTSHIKQDEDNSCEQNEENSRIDCYYMLGKISLND